MFLPPGRCRLGIQSRTESGGGGSRADLLRRVTLTDRLIVDKQLDSTVAAVALTVICWMLSWMTTALHPSLSLLHKGGGGPRFLWCRWMPPPAEAAPALVSLCHHYGVTRQGSRRTAANKKVGERRRRRRGAGLGVTLGSAGRRVAHPSSCTCVPEKATELPVTPRGGGGATRPGATRHMTRWGSSLSN